MPSLPLPLRILYLHPLALPGVEANQVQVAETCRALADRGNEVTWMLYKLKASPQDCLRPLGVEPHPALRIIGNRRIRLSNYGRFHSLSVRSKLLRRLRSMAEPGRTVLYFRTLRDSRLARFLIIASRLLGIPVIYEAHKLYTLKRIDQSFHELSVARARRLEARVFGGVSGVVCSHPLLADAIRSEHRLKGPMIIAPNAVTLAPATRETPEFDAVYVGSLFDWKGVDVCIEAACRIAGVRLAIVGGNPPARLLELKERVAELGVQDRVTFFGQLERDQALEVLSRARTALVPLDPGYLEGDRFTCPLKMLEAMMRGVPIIAADTPALRVFLEHGRTALLTPGGDAVRLAEAIARLRDDRALADRIAAAARVGALEHSFPVRAERIEAFARELLAKA